MGTSITGYLTAEQIAQTQANQATMASAGLSQPPPPRPFVFFAAFDDTNNYKTDFSHAMDVRNNMISKSHQGSFTMKFIKSVRAVIGALCFTALLSAGHSAMAQLAPPSSAKPLSDAEVKAKYQNCASGWYSGPRPGKTRYAKDPWLWVVSPEFAQRFCMPPEFVSNDLKGAEAVAFRILRKTDEENCGFGGNPDACAGEVVLRFDVYIKSETKLPRMHEGRYYQSSLLPSAKLIGHTEREWKFLREQTKNKPEPALKPHFESQQVGLDGVKDGKVAWPIVSLSQETHFGGVYEGIDYYAFEGSTGFFENPGIQQNQVKRFHLTFLKLGQKSLRTTKGLSVQDYAHVIELPEAFTDQIAEADRSRGRNVRALLKEAFAPLKPAASAPTNR